MKKLGFEELCTRFRERGRLDTTITRKDIIVGTPSIEITIDDEGEDGHIQYVSNEASEDFGIMCPVSLFLAYAREQGFSLSSFAPLPSKWGNVPHQLRPPMGTYIELDLEASHPEEYPALERQVEAFGQELYRQCLEDRALFDGTGNGNLPESISLEHFYVDGSAGNPNHMYYDLNICFQLSTEPQNRIVDITLGEPPVLH